MLQDNNAIIYAEYRLLNAIYNEPEILDSEDFSYDLFVHNTAKSIAQAIDEITTKGFTLSKESVFQTASLYNMNVTSSTVEEVIGLKEEPIKDIRDIKELLLEAKKSLKSLEYVEELKDALNSLNRTENQNNDIREKIENLESELFSQKDDISRVMNMKEWGESWQQEFKERRNGKKYFFNDPTFDRLIVDGPIPGTGGLIVAASGAGKSAKVLKLMNNCINSNIPCMMFTLEMGAVSTYDRLLSMRTEIPYADIVNPKTPEDFESIKDILYKEKEILDKNERFAICEDASLNLRQIKKKIKKFQTKIGQKYCIIFFDLITMIQDFTKAKGGMGMPATIEVAINEVNALSKELGFHYVGTAQLNRSAETERIVDIDDIDKLRPTKAQIKNSGALAERCRYVISLFRKKYYVDALFPEDEEGKYIRDTVEVSVLKQNNGKCMRAYELFDGPTFSMTPLNTEVEIMEE